MKLFSRIVMIGLAVLLVGCEHMGHHGGGKSEGSKSKATGSASGSGHAKSNTMGASHATNVKSAPAPSSTPTRSMSGKGVMITKPASSSKHKAGPVEVCMETNGYTVEPAKNGVNDGKGHHHLILDVGLPNLNSPIPKDATHVHMGDGSKCKTLTFGPGVHTITALFAKGNHVPYNPPVKDTIFIYVSHSN